MARGRVPGAGGAAVPVRVRGAVVSALGRFLVGLGLVLAVLVCGDAASMAADCSTDPSLCPSPSASPSASSSTTPEPSPSATVTVTETATPAPCSTACGTGDAPLVVEPSSRVLGSVTVFGVLVAVSLGALLVKSFR